MKSSLEKRLGLLKGRVGGEAVTLHMSDGTERWVNGSTRHYFCLWSHATARFQAEDAGEVPPASPRLDTELGWLKSCTKILEVAGQWNLLKIMLLGPVDTEEEEVI